jgi:beta-glucosidase
MRIISGMTDFLGVNYYSREYARAACYVPFLGAWVDQVDTSAGERVVNGYQFTNFNREVYPHGFYERLIYIKDRCSNPPIYITENGASYTDKLVEGRVHDPLRIAFLEGYMDEAANAARDGVDLRGYFIWTLMDNFEWREGYSKRFGLVYVDHATQQRAVKDSGYWVRDMIRSQ